MVAKLGEDNVEVVATGCGKALTEYDQLCKELVTVKSAVKGWNKNNYVQKYIEAFKLLQEAAKTNQSIEHDLGVLKAVRLLEVGN